ncbi:uncharacterized protein LOC110427470 isoform X3 [Herrania umbratica]|uniref:Uncharacterized protein LOC110427470 isoform X3 n=1 Tax=Herrania umbratica TaxID=108875 RepID=A0A6J1BGW8_9ROSI|nr:uncharacterized protein LOC110427470 isoform X3 [Herrania umbratica]
MTTRNLIISNHKVTRPVTQYLKKPRRKSPRCPVACNRKKAGGQKMEDGSVQKSLKWLVDLSKGTISHELEALTLEGLQSLQGQKGFIRYGNWHVGAMATLIDDVGAAAIYSVADHVKASLDFSISIYSTAKIQEEVEIEAKVTGDKGKLAHVVVEVRRKENRELIALGKQWMASSKDSAKAAQGSKL